MDIQGYIKDYTSGVSVEGVINDLLFELKNDQNNALLEVFDDEVTRMYIKESQDRFDSGTQRALEGVPFVVKDNMLVKGRISSAGSKILERYHASYTSSVIADILDQGAIVVARANMDEFAMGSSTETSAYGVVKNPHDPTRVAGGSSGGSAAAVASTRVPFSLGTDTGGSIRQPASLCGIVGYKPTYGAVSRYGLIAMASSLDQAGTFTHSVSDAKKLFSIIRKEDKRDATTLPQATWDSLSKEYTKKQIIGIPRHLIEMPGVDEDVKSNFYASIEKMKEQGYTLVDVEIPAMEKALAAYYVIVPAEVSSNLARFDGVKYGLYVEGKSGIDDYFQTRKAGFGEEVKRRIILGTYVLSAGYYDSYYGSAQKFRSKIQKDMQEVFKKVDVLATPTSPVPAFLIGEKAHDPLSMYVCDIFTVSVNIANLPGISVPSGFVSRQNIQLPVGMQFIGPFCGDEHMLDVASDFETLVAKL